MESSYPKKESLSDHWTLAPASTKLEGIVSYGI